MPLPINSKLIKRYNTPIDETVIYDPLALVTKAKGSFVWIEGQRDPYFDLLMSYSSTNFGHVNNDILKFVKDAVEKFDNIIAFNSAAKVGLSKKLVDLLPYPDNKIPYFPVGGTKAIDAAIKLAKAYTGKDVIIAFSGDFHGYSYAAMSVTDSEYIEKSQFGSYPGKVKQFPFPHRLTLNSSEVVKNILASIENYLQINHHKVAAVIFEPIQGAAGFLIPPDGFLKKLISLAQKYGVLTICDEIQTGVYRTGTFYYVNQLDLNPDIILLGKSLAGGYYPLSAVIANKIIFESVDPKHSGFDSTFATNLLGIEIAHQVVEYAEKKNLSKVVQTTGNIISSKLRSLLNNFNFIKDFDSIGMAYGYRVEAPSKKREDNSALATKIKKEAFNNHLIIQTAGLYGDHMKLSPNFFITQEEIDSFITEFTLVLKKVYSEI